MVSTQLELRCKGRGENGLKVLETAVEAKVTIYYHPGSQLTTLSAVVECPYNTGSHGQRCKASHQASDNVGKEIFCRYSLDLPYAIDSLEAEDESYNK